MVFPLLLTAFASAAPPAFEAPAPPSRGLAIAPPAAVIAPAPEAVSPARPAARTYGFAHARSDHELATPRDAGLRIRELVAAEDAILREIRRGGFPGAAVAIGRKGKIVVERGIGRVGWDDTYAKVDPDQTVYDVASLTKVIATTSAVMVLDEEGKMSLDAPVWRYLPEWRSSRADDARAARERDLVTIRDLLTHTSGLPAWADVWAPTPEAALRRAIRTPLVREPGARTEYSDIGFVVLWAAAERAAGEPLYQMLDRRVFRPLGMTSTTFVPGEQCFSCAPTHRTKDGEEFRGRVHDPIAHRLGGVAGNAGLFSTAHDLARFAAMMANGGTLEGERIFFSRTIRQFTERQPGAETRALGWDTPAWDGSGAAGLRISPRAFGHTGFTGTSMWIDPDRGTWTVILSNRTFEARARARMQPLRRTVHDWVATASDSGRVLASSPVAEASVAR